MNKQLTVRDDKVISRGIEWTDFTWNPVGGCKHGCMWKMPGGQMASCYAESVAFIFRKAYPEGFAHHYFRPHLLGEPKRVNEPSRIFLDSMSDLMGAWVPDDQILQVFEACRQAPWHDFQLLTKIPARLLKFVGHFPPNLWAGFSAPPSVFMGKTLTPAQQTAMVRRGLDVLRDIEGEVKVRWMSIEPLSFDVAQVFNEWTRQSGRALPLDWAVIGAASNGSKHFPPEAQHVRDVHTALRESAARIFHKGNLVWTPHLEEFPTIAIKNASPQGASGSN